MLPECLRAPEHRFGLPDRASWSLFLKAPYPKPREFWLAYRSGRLVGRIGACLSILHPGVGYVGFYEVALEDGEASAREVTVELLATAEAWLKSQGVTRVHGPLNFSTWFQHRFRVQPDSDPYRFEFEPVHPPEYVSLFCGQGYRVCGTYKSEGLKSFESLETHAKVAFDKTTAAGWRYRSVSAAEFRAETIPALYRISMVAFSKNYLFEPISEPVFTALYAGLPDKTEIGHSQLMIAPDGNIAGFGLFLVDQGHIMLKSTAVLPQYQGQGISNGMIWPAIESARLQIRHFAGVMFKADNRSSSYTRHGELLWTHVYELYEKTI